MTGIFEIKTPDYNGRGQFCLLSFRYYCEENNIELGDLGNALDGSNLFAIADLIYYSCKAYADLNDNEFELSKAKFTNVFAEIEEKELAKIVEKLQETKLFGKKLGAADNKPTNSNKKK